MLIYGEFQAGVRRFFFEKLQVPKFQYYRILKKSIIYFDNRKKGGLNYECLILSLEYLFD